MLKSFRVILSLSISLTIGVNAFAQDKVEYKDVLLDGKPAKLNIATGEITLLKLKDKNAKTKTDSVKTKSIIVTGNQIINASNVKVIKDSNTISDFHIVKEGENLLKYLKSIIRV